MSNFWIFAVIVALAIGWFMLDRPVEPGELVQATIVEISPINIPTGPPESKLIAKLSDGTTVNVQIPRNDALSAGATITLQRLKRRLSGIAAYSMVAK